MNQASRFFNQALHENTNQPKCREPEDDDIEIPDSYDFRSDPKTVACVQPVRKTGNCTASHTLAAVSTVEDRMCISKDGTETFQLSAQDVVSCNDENYHCGGGYASKVFEYGAQFGFVKESCFEYLG